VNVLALMAPSFLQQSDGGGAAAGGLGGLISIVFWIYIIACIWMVFSKAGQPGWYGIIPIWNTLVLLKISGKPWWWIILLLIPLVNIVILIMAMIALGRSFGHGAAFSILLLTCLSPIGFGILAFSGNRYLGPGGGGY
jgi:hypothetical protein